MSFHGIHRTEAPLQITRAPRTRGAFVSMESEPIAPVAIDVLLQPGAALNAIVRSPRAGAWFFAGSVLFALVAFVALSRVETAMHRLLETGGPARAPMLTELVIAQEMRARVIGAPATLAASAAPALLVLGLVQGLTRTRVGVRTLITIALAAEMPVLVGRLVDLEMLWVEGVEVTRELVPLPLRSTTSLGEVVAVSRESRIGSVAESLSPFTMWSAGFVALAARRVLRAKKSVALASWAATLGIRLACAALDETGAGLG